MRGRIPILAVLSILLATLSYFIVPTAAETRGQAAPAKGKDWAVVIGINDYQKAPRLRYAIQDAMAIGDLLEQQGFTVIRKVSSEDTTRQSIETVLGTELPRKLGTNDRVLIFFSGHGKDEQFGAGQRTGYLLPMDANPKNFSATAISMGRVREWANAWPAKHVLFIVDSCYSGIIGENTKGFPNEMTSMYREDITREPSRQLIVAGEADQEALEVREWEQSLLTHFLLEGLGRDKTADLDANGIITAQELHVFLESRVWKEAELKGHKQRPQYWSLSPGHKGQFVFPGQAQQERPVQPARIPSPSSASVPSPAMTRIEPGSFMMGGGTEENATPSHLVQFTRPFAIARHETTFDEYDRFAQATGRPLPKDRGWGRGSRPVINVSWEDANAYAQWLSQQTGERYRLPTEAEWEYAARSGGNDQTWAGTSNMKQLKDYAVYASNRTEPVGSKQPNRLGLNDMSGNVWEWVEDCWHEKYDGAPPNGSAWIATNGGDCTRRVLRGGSWDNNPEYLRTLRRLSDNADFRYNSIGFRLVQELP
ncbi:MAG: SUMF1/EgtB/PvdO family nonheme iron enzyme [Nitrospira sp.]|nr:SUMF1/EgtB/PvdO family nonheme iron enzyme [Nitrospira sp.]